MNVLEEAKNKMAQVMTKYRYKIEDIEREEYEEIDEIAINVLKQLPIYTEITHNGEYAKFIEVVPSKQVFRIFKRDKVIELGLEEVLNLALW
jgi:hypothetical protein